MDTQTITTHDPCPEWGGFDGAYWTDSGPGWDSWRCGCTAEWIIQIEEPTEKRV